MSKNRIFLSSIVILALIFVTVLVGLRQTTPSQAAAVKIMALGDSITGSPGCWRAMLWNKLIANGYTDFTPVGTLGPAGCANDIPNDNHEGHGGLLATGIANGDQLPPWLAATNPDIVLMHLGTNDSFSAANTPEMILAAYTKMVGQMRANNPKMIILVAQIIPLYSATGQCPVCYQNVVNLNTAIPAWASGLTTTQSPIIVVDQWTGFDTTTDTGDGIHPNEVGFQKMADKWFPTLAQVLSGVIPTNTPTITPGGPTLTPTRTLTPTTTPVPSVQINIQGAGTDTTSQTSFNLQIVNTAAGGLANLSWRLYFTLDNSNAASAYTLEKYYDQSAAATISGPTLACNNIYYFTVSYGATALPTGTTWAYNTALHLSSFASTFDSTNDWWRTGYTTGSLPTSFTADAYFPAYINGNKFYGNEPTCGPTPTYTLTPSISKTASPTSTPTATLATRTLTPTPAITNTSTSTLTRTPTPVISPTPTRTFTAGPTSNRTSTPAITNTPTRTWTAGPTNTRTLTPAVTLTRTVTSFVPTLTSTITPTVIQSTMCNPVTSTITAPFTYDGAGTFCWQSSNLGSYVNSWNLTSLTINNVNFTNLYVAAGSYPAKSNGYWYVSYNSAVSYGHFEAK